MNVRILGDVGNSSYYEWIWLEMSAACEMMDAGIGQFRFDLIFTKFFRHVKLTFSEISFANQILQQKREILLTKI